ncbi:MAG: hypothetical protein JWQ72_751, partial [Polaromonas sp.]|nr:hypothetical protein [Polaromonas sp.]
MIIWGIFWGAVLGIFWPGMGDVGIFAGAFFGFFIGLSARWAVRREVAAQRKKDWQAVAVQPAAEPAVVTVSAASTLPHAQAVRSAEAAATSSVQAASGSAAANEAAAASRDVPLKAAPVPRAPATAPAAPAAPGAIDLAILAAKNWLLGGNTIVRVGLVILFIGLSFLARYAATAGLFPVEFRLAAIGVAAIVLLGVGFTKRHARPGFALALQGGGVAVLYLTVFAAFRLYGLMPPLLAFGLMIVVCALSCALALLQDSRALAVAAFAGGFAVPLLLSTGEGSHVGLFSYYTVLNLAILFIAHQRSWRILNAVGFVATFGVATAWGVLKYAPAQYASTQPFLVAFVLIYVAAAVLYARNTPTRLGNAVDSLLVFGTPLAGFGLQAGLVQQFELGAAFSALAFAAGYLMLAGVLVRRGPGNYRLLMESFLALGVGFVTLAVPL